MGIIQPIGVFDSGVGGLSVVRHLITELPQESIIYFADSARAPYGNKNKEEVVQYAKEITETFLEKDAKLIVVACNTATGMAINELRQSFSLPFVGMEPAIKPAALSSKTGKIGVLATANTFEAEHFNRTKNRFANDVEVFMAIGDGLVELVEQGKAKSLEAKKLLEAYLQPMIEEEIDQLVLGCTHYPFLMPLIEEILPIGVHVHDPAPAVAKQVRRVLEEKGALAQRTEEPFHSFTSSGDSSVLNKMVKNKLLLIPSP